MQREVEFSFRVEKLFRPITFHPRFEQLKVMRVFTNRGERDLVRAEGAFDGDSIHFLRTCPALWGAQDDHRPSGNFRDAFFAGARHAFVVENNYTGQLERLIRYVMGPLERMHPVRKYDGKPFRPIEIIAAIEKFALREEGELHATPGVAWSDERVAVRVKRA